MREGEKDEKNEAKSDEGDKKGCRTEREKMREGKRVFK